MANPEKGLKRMLCWSHCRTQHSFNVLQQSWISRSNLPCMLMTKLGNYRGPRALGKRSEVQQACRRQGVGPAEGGALGEGSPDEVLRSILLQGLVPAQPAAAVRSAAAVQMLQRLLGLQHLHSPHSYAERLHSTLCCSYRCFST